MSQSKPLYEADLAEAKRRNGTFTATLRGNPALIVTSPNAEHDLCDAMLNAGLPDGPIQFWRGDTPSLRFPSVHRAAGFRIELGDDCPYRRVRRRSAAGFQNLRCGVRQDGKTASEAT
jgi:hypothetical protein